MAVFRIIDGHILSQSEFQARSPEITQHLNRRVAGRTEKPLALSGGRVLGVGAPAAQAPTPFTPIGLNLPLTILIRDVYTGRYPKDGIFGSSGDIAVVSGVKNYAVFDATARALNFVKSKVSNHQHLAASAFDQGTPVVANAPAVTTDSLTMTVELSVAQFPKELLDYLSTAFKSLAGVPILLPYAGYLLGAGSIIKLASGLGDALFDGHPPFSITESLNFDVPGSAPPVADFRVLCGSNLQADQYSFEDGKGLVDKASQPYRGDEPYVVISLDGKVRPDLKNFAPSVASSAILQKFFQMKDGAEATIETLVNGVKLLSDFKYRQQAVELKQQISQMPDGADKTAAQARYTALVSNIVEGTLKP